MANIQLSLAIGEYDHVRDLLDGTVRADGIDLTVMRLPIEEMFYRFLKHHEFDVSEVSFGKVVSLISQNDTSVVPIPVFPSRVHRHSSIYVRTDGGITKPGQLAGKRVGVPEWAQTAAVYSRGMLVNEYGIDLKSIHWHQGGVYSAGRAEKIKLKLPAGMNYTVVKDRSLLEMLRSGDLDAVLSARPLIIDGDTRVRRLFEDYQPVELAYWKKTGIFPIMHVVAMRREIYERNRWVAMNLFKAFEAAKNRSVARLADITASYSPLPWTPDHMRLSGELLGADCWPYGLEANRATLEAFTQYAFEHGVCHRKVAVEELFPPEVQSSHTV